MAGFYIMSGSMKRGDTRVLSVNFSVAWRTPGDGAMSFLGLEKKTFLVFGVANRRSVAWAVGRSLEEEGARVVYSVRSEARRRSLEALLAGRPVLVCDVEKEGAAERLASEVAAAGHAPLQGLVHSIAFANYSDGLQPFHATRRKRLSPVGRRVRLLARRDVPRASGPTWRATPRSWR